MTTLVATMANDENNNNNNNDLTTVKFLIHYQQEATVIYLPYTLTIEVLYNHLSSICHLALTNPPTFTIKWLDESLDAITMSSQRELNTAMRLYKKHSSKELHLHVFSNRPEQPGLLCPGEDPVIYRRGARRWRKLYLIHGHRYQAKRFSTTAACTVCNDRLWGLGRQGYKCLDCRVLVHKRCVKQLRIVCGTTSPQHSKFNDLNEQLTSVNSKVNGHQNGFHEPIDGHRPSNVSAGNSRDSMSKQKMSNTSKSGPTKRTHGVTDLDHNSIEDPNGAHSNLIDADVDMQNSTSTSPIISLQDFELLKVIGRGSYAKVFLAEYRPRHLRNNQNNNQTPRLYAMKVIKKSIVNDDEDIDWIQCEKNVFEKATNHPFLVGLHSCFQTPSRLFFVIEFVTGGDLMYHMQRQRKLPESSARFYAAEMTIALHFLHEHGVIYRDLKLDNVLLDADGHIKLTDYGMCKEGLDFKRDERTSTFCGTPNYLAPEMLRNDDYNFSVDWWALGVLMFEMMAGRSPFEIVGSAENPDLNTEDRLFQVILEQPIRIPRSLTVKAKNVLDGFLNKNPSNRLGCRYDQILGCRAGFQDICLHPFFHPAIDWQRLEAKQITPPYRPMLTEDNDLSHFDPQFTNEDVILTPEDEQVLARIQQSEFEGFEYVNPLIMTVEGNV
ncbi:unnamed protein product [Rotaria socialis]|uniref:protein kinase C n=1 Tax=Rotaria socialis TaxID=392032 RepID=A0A818BPJ2_9BILA|nr:unnamed protein product [Rotaria socialis]CAF3419108.1 unnamed protein product [Rotaria socialis]CAF3452871.1 unnamed protein product [Rotaria socialis]CAF4209689.1 unnamed protein product [Rotaria socialis]CAF4217494.1 unnamed protein product [Rotaria socialis]